jgi:DNA-binding MarR family transcriptional regulator
MLTQIQEKPSDVLALFGGLSQVLRCCCREEAFCGGVTFHQFMILDAVANAKELHLVDLHQILSVEKSTTTRLVNPLIGKGLLQRSKADHDSRAAKLTLTKEGIETHRKVSLCLTEYFQKVLGNIPPAKRSEVLESVKIFIEAIKSAANGCNCC